jgi:hypothetical protein
MWGLGLVEHPSWTDAESMVPVQWRDLHVVDTGAPEIRLYRAVVLDAMQGVGRYVRAIERGTMSPHREHERRELIDWLSAQGVATAAYQVPFSLAMAYGFPGMNVGVVRRALLAALRVIPAPSHRAFDHRVLRRHYVRHHRVDVWEVA